MAERGLSGEVGLGGKRRISPVGSGVKRGAPRPSQARCSLLILRTAGRAWGSCGGEKQGYESPVRAGPLGHELYAGG